MGERSTYTVQNEKLRNYIETNTTKRPAAINKIIEHSLSLTSAKLNFTPARNHNDPNLLINSRTAHCVGYAQFFTSTCNYLLKKYDQYDTWIARPQVGQIYFLGANVHKYLNSPFLKDHDFVKITNLKTGEVIAVDPSVHDYFLINYIKYIN